MGSGPQSPPDDAPRAFRRLGSTPLPMWGVRVLSVLVLGSAAALPWLAQWRGVLPSPPPESVEVVVGEHERVQLRPELVRLPGGTFTMGSPAEHPDRRYNEREHESSVAAFEICRTEVTQSQWTAVMGTEPSVYWRGISEHRPATEISWEMAVEYLLRLTERENELMQSSLTQCYEKLDDHWQWTRHDCTGYRLPTEAEWEYAARANTTTAYSFGNDPEELDSYAWHFENSEHSLHPVGTKRANPWKLYDMHGGIWEWVWDWYADEYQPDAGSLDYKGPRMGRHKVLRGGSYNSQPHDLRSAVRYWYLPNLIYQFSGIRCVRSLGTKPSSP